MVCSLDGEPQTSYAEKVFNNLERLTMPTNSLLATVMPGARAFNERNINDTYRGQIAYAEEVGKAAILKDLDPVQLFNELLAFLVAKEIGLPVPEGFLAIDRDGNINTKHAPKIENKYPILFASLDVKQPNLYARITIDQTKEEINSSFKSIIKALVQWQFLGALYGFDTWIANIDRHCGNLLYDGDKKFWLIDHGHSFSGPDWPHRSLNPSGGYQNRLKEWLTPSLIGIEKTQTLENSDDFLTPIPCEIFSTAIKRVASFGFIPENCIDSLQKFLDGRKPYVNEYVKEALGVLV